MEENEAPDETIEVFQAESEITTETEGYDEMLFVEEEETEALLAEPGTEVDDFSDIENPIIFHAPCGKDAFWHYELGRDTLYIMGEGEMNNYGSDDNNRAPWQEYRDDIKHVVVESGITGIGEYSFMSLTQVVSVELPNTLKTISEAAFLECEALGSIQIPDSVTKIGFAAFAGCDSLESLVIPDSVTELGGNVAGSCKNLKSVTLPENLTSLPWAVVVDDTAITSFRIPENIAVIETYCFAGCSSLRDVNIPEGLTLIDKRAFQETALTSITLPESVENIALEAFLDCSALEEVTILSRKYEIGDHAFGYRRITDETFEKATPVTIKAYRGTQGETYAKENGLPFVALDEEEKATSGQCGENAYWEYTATDGTLSITGSGRMYDYETIDAVPDTPHEAKGTTAPWNGLNYQRVRISGLENIGKAAFAGYDSSLKEVIIEGNMKEIGDHAFDSCNSLETIHLPSTVIKIGSWAFYYCISLEEVTLPAGVTEISDYAFLRCWNLKRINLEHVQKLGEYAFGSGGIREVTFSSALTAIGRGCFNCCPLEKVSLPDSVTEIGAWAFSACKSLKEVKLPSGIKEISAHTFDGTAIEQIILPDSITKIGEAAFISCEMLRAVNLPKNLKYIDGQAFYACKAFTEMTIPAGVESVGEEAFVGCDLLKSITVLNKNTAIASYAFGYNWKHEKLENNLTIQGYAGSTAETYAKENSITFIVLEEEKVTSGQCGDHAYWNYDEKSGTLSITGSGDMYDYIHEQDVAGDHITLKMPWCDFPVKKVELSGITSIGEDAFYHMRTVTEATMSDSIIRMGDAAFAGCSSLKTVRLSSSLQEIPDFAFYHCNFRSIQLPSSVKRIGRHAFTFNDSLSAITVPASVKYIGMAFSDCPALKEITILNKNTQIEEMLGYSSYYEVVELNITIKGYTGSTAEAFVKQNKEWDKACRHKFYALDKAENIKKETISIVTAAPRKQGMVLAWKPSKNAEDYKVFRKSGSGKYTEVKATKSREKNMVGCIDKTVKSGTNYTYKVIGYYKGIASKTKEKTAYYLSEPKVTLKNTTTGINVAWTKVTGASGYYIYRKASGGKYVKVATAKSTAKSYLDKKATAGKTNTYKVYAYKTSPKTSSSYTEQSILYLKPTKLSLTRKNVKATTIGLKWTKVAGAKGYYIYRKSGKGSYKKIATINKATTLNYTDKKVKKGVKYTYYVAAFHGRTVAPYIPKTK